MSNETYLKKWSKETGKTLEELQEIWDQAQKAMDRLGLGEDEQAVQGAFRRKLRGAVFGKGKTRRTPVEFFGFVFGASKLMDWDEIRRTSALKKYNENPTDAVLNGIVDEAGNPLDTKEFIYKFGQKVDNPNYRKPLVGNSYERKIYGFAKKEDSEDIKIFRLNLRGKTAKEFKGWKPFTPVRFLGLVYGEGDFYELYPSRMTKFSTDDKTKIDYEKWIRTAAHVYKLDKLDQAFDNTKDAVDNWAFLEADLDFISPNIDQDRGQRSLNITDDCIGLQTYRVRLPQDFPISFSEYSRVIVMGEIQKYTRQDQSSGVAIEGFGIFPLPSKTIKLPEKNAMPAEATEEEPIILWE